VKTDRNILNNKPDILSRDNEKGTCNLVQAANLRGRNSIKKEAEKFLISKDITMEI
jgi:hypothetical protein